MRNDFKGKGTAMKCFLTSYCLNEEGELNPANSFVDELKSALNPRICGLFVASAPEEYDDTDCFSHETKGAFEESGFRFNRYDVLDRRTASQTETLVSNADIIVLCGGHVPTQNRFFEEIGLRRTLAGFNGVVVGVSAGSVNCADVVYSPPELEGEAVDPNYRRFLRGLNLTKTSLIPHYNELVKTTLDGLNYFRDVLIPDSDGRKFYGINDGGYLYIHDGQEELRGESYLLENGNATRLIDCGERTALH